MLIVESDPIALEQLQREFHARDSATCAALDSPAAMDLIERECRNCDGLITNIDLDGVKNGWELARLARELNPDIPIGYMSSEGHRDWVVFGVPNSVLLNKAIDDAEIATTFLRFCGSARRSTDRSDGAWMARAGARPGHSSPPPSAALVDLHALFMESPSFIAFLDGPEHRFSFANSAYLKLAERDPVGRCVIDAFPEVVDQGFVDILDRIYQSGEPFIAKGMTIAFRRPDGTAKTAFIDLNYHAVRNVAGQITGIFVSGEDVTELQETQRRIGALQNEQIHVARVNAMGMMVSTIAHELNQPLTVIHNYMAAAKMILERQAHHPAALEAVQGAVQGAADAALRAGDIIRNLKAMTARRDVVRVPVPLDQTLREAVALATLGQPDIDVDFDLRCDATVLGDKIQIQQVLFNLVRNALEAAAGRIGLTITTADLGPLVEICVGDTGPGIDPAVLPEIFDSFVTTKAEGTGIGLSICKSIVEAHGGSIEARNNPAGGAQFRFTLPQLA